MFAAVALAGSLALSGSLTVAAPAAAATRTAVFAGGCFWSVEKFFEATPGVVTAVSGYSGGTTANPTYENHRGHLEAVKVTYDPAKVSYAQLVEKFYRNIDPTDPAGQFCDKGPSYRTAVFVANDAERQIAEAEKAKVEKLLGARVTVATRVAAPFWNAEAYHQDYAKKNPAHYERYRIGCRRDQSLKAVWAGR
ncbi:peptide-methionine (S)-S-oxide reductase MsrA [Phenylobacterium sp. SCN 70-31]|uniref:peptide-methionine (S)-S-oxide reductase MsrA n=1 Tax=Phenylobacterium sp. SCN 70-31 TaxID=1660129 RepID=UPI00086EDDF9|nr:peptide-methionine (S)-S-oxide reductase MsrA [Phenylobacterium sp. SCN 70-31]ODT85498.1 MAG: peptide-methionine (S)-S-oxide reductase [Phenylobacterium sp. SCN 70-31]